MSVDELEAAVLEAVRQARESLPKTVIDELKQRSDVTDAQVSEAIWRLVASHRVQLTKNLRLRSTEQPQAPAS